jgi:hypothetical protein
MISDEKIKTICDNIVLGMPYRQACAGAGISYSAYRNWIIRGEEEIARVEANPKATVRKDEEIYVKLVNDIKEAEARGMRNNLAMITKASKEGAWQASAWILERRYPHEFGRKEAIEMNNKHSGGITIQIEEVDGDRDEEN